MRRKQVWRYYCDFCKKSGCSAGHIKRHERGCTNNPNRTCSYCRAAGLEQKTMSELIEVLGDGTDLTAIRDLSENCPACILAAIRQAKLQSFDTDENGAFTGFSVDFDFNKEKEEFWSDVNYARESRYA